MRVSGPGYPDILAQGSSTERTHRAVAADSRHDHIRVDYLEYYDGRQPLAKGHRKREPTMNDGTTNKDSQYTALRMYRDCRSSRYPVGTTTSYRYSSHLLYYGTSIE